MRSIRIKLCGTMIVCVCHRVSDRDIAIAAAAGCPDFETLQDELRVATACGACHDCACAVFEESRVAGGSPCARGMAAVTQALIAA
jgi:bacterioferritin-associated ferredoxin